MTVQRRVSKPVAQSWLVSDRAALPARGKRSISSVSSSEDRSTVVFIFGISLSAETSHTTHFNVCRMYLHAVPKRWWSGSVLTMSWRSFHRRSGGSFACRSIFPSSHHPEWFRENIHAIAHRLKKETKASVAFCSLPPIGEDPTSAVALQSELNRRIEEYSGTIRDVALKEDVDYIPLHEAMLAQIRASPGRAFTSFRFLPFYRDAFRVVVLRKTPDEVAQLNGWRFHSDGIHLNSRGGIIAVDLIQQFID